MGLPGIEMSFRTTAIQSIALSTKGVLGMILQDANEGAFGVHVMTGSGDIPAAFDEDNAAYVRRAFMGYVSAPRKIIAYVMGAGVSDLTAALNYFATEVTDYIVGPYSCTTQQAQAIAQWVKERRTGGYTDKAVLPDTAFDNEGVVNFVAEDIKANGETFQAAQYASRIAGIIAGTPMNISCTFAPLGEVSDVKRLTKAELDTAIDGGKLVLYHDGEKVKVARGVNSLQSTNATKGEAFKKIKIVETVDMIRKDVTRTAEDSYIGKYENTYDNKCVLIAAIMGYFEQLEQSGLLERGRSSVTIDMEAQRAYLKGQGTAVDTMSEQAIKEANTGSKVFLKGNVTPIDAIEDIRFDIVL